MSTAHHFSSSRHGELAVHLRQQLVESLRQSGVLHSPALQHAFLSVPREAFVPRFYEQETTRHDMAWKLVAASEMEEEEYLVAVYRNDTLVTTLDERGWPVSSSSLPAVMAQMLEALDVQPGQRILEIGTGSGYNAALLAQLVGSAGRVISIERDAALVTQAAHALAQAAGSVVTVIVGDGVAGWLPAAPYDRIIATASAPTVPMAWVEQLRPGGKLVMDVQGTLASRFLVVEKTPEGKTSGSFLAAPLHFMPLQTDALSVPHVQSTRLLRQPCLETFVLDNDAAFPGTLFEPAFRWFLQWSMPGCQIGTYTQEQHAPASVLHGMVVMDPLRNALLRLQKVPEETRWQGSVYGALPLWAELQHLSHVFSQLGEPLPQQYHVVVEQDGPCLLIGSLKLPLAKI